MGSFMKIRWTCPMLTIAFLAAFQLLSPCACVSACCPLVRIVLCNRRCRSIRWLHICMGLQLLLICSALKVGRH
jgi:hypothetical protein